MSGTYKKKPKAMHYSDIFAYAAALESYIKYLQQTLDYEGYYEEEARWT